jgi:hypothetical protein
VTAQIIQFPIARRIAEVEGEVVAEVPAEAVPAGYDFTPPMTNRFAHVDCKPAKRGTRKRAKMRVETLAAICTRTPKKHSDMRQQVGVLVIDWKRDQPYTVTFDPSDEKIPNIVAPVEGFGRTETAISVKSDEGAWGFQLLLDDDVVEAK